MNAIPVPHHMRLRVAMCAALCMLPVMLPSPRVAPLVRRSPALFTTRVKRYPIALAVDTRTRRLFVLNRGEPTLSAPPHKAASVTTLDLMSGRVLGTVPVGHDPAPLLLDAAAGRVFVLNQEFGATGEQPIGPVTLSVLDAATGRLRHTVALGGAVAAITVDERDGRVFVLPTPHPTNGAHMDYSMQV